MNYRLLSKVLGLLLFLLGGTMLFCWGYAAWEERELAQTNAFHALGLSLGITCLMATILVFAGRGSGKDMFRKEAIAIVGLGWLLCGGFGALPYLFCQPHLGFCAALFESISGFTTTGATVINDLDQFPRSILLWRAITQWLGGLGILVLFVALLAHLGVGSKSLFRHESSAHGGEGLTARIRGVALRLWLIYLFLSAICFAGLYLLGMSWFDALAHTFTAISTGGFSPRNQSIAAYQSVGIELWLILFMILGGISFMLYAWLLRGRWNRWQKEEETKNYLWLLLLATLVLTVDLLILRQYPSVWESLRGALFQVVSIMTTTGYVTANFDQWPPFSRMILLLLMFVGGCAGSTAGGLKVSRWTLFLKIVRAEIIAVFRPNQVIALHLNGSVVDERLKRQVLFLIALAAVSVAIGSAVVSMLEPSMDMLSSISAIVASLFNIGPGLGMVGPTHTFAHLGPFTMILLSLFMVLGRLEFFALLVLFVPALWRKY